MGKSKDKLYLMTYLECKWVENRSYVRTYERIELEDYIKLALKVKLKYSGDRCYDRQYIIDRVEELESGWIQDLGTYDETIFSPSLLIKTNSKANAKKLIMRMEKERELHNNGYYGKVRVHKTYTKEERQEYGKSYREKNKEKIKEYQKNYRAMKKIKEERLTSK